MNPFDATVLHHRLAGEDIITRILRSGDLRLDPPGITFSIDRVLAAANG